MSRTFYADLACQVGMTYGFFVAAVGVMGYMKAGSLISMYAGVASGIMASGSAFYADKRNMTRGLKVLLATALLLVVVFHRRYQATQEFMPGAFMAINSALIVVISALGLRSTQVAAAAAPVSDKKKK